MTDQLKNKIIAAIQKGEVTMKPRWHFVLRSTLLFLGVIITALGLLFVSSFVLFLLRVNGVFFAPLFGLFGLRSFIFALPWLLLFFTLLFVIVLEVLARFYGVGRRIPLLYSAFGIIAFVILSTFIIGQTTFHERLSARAIEGRLPLMGGMYKSLGEPADVHRGRISELVDGGFIMTERRGGTTSVTVTPDTRLPYGMNFHEEDIVVVIGEKNSDSIIADGILKVKQERFDPSMGEGLGRRGGAMRMVPVRSLPGAVPPATSSQIAPPWAQ